VIIPLTVTVPLVAENVALLRLVVVVPVLSIVKFPVIVKLEMVDVIIVVRFPDGATVVPTFTDAQDNVPDPIIEHALLALTALFRLTALVTVTVMPLFILRVADAPVKVIDAHVVVTSPVRVTPFGIITASVEIGTPEGDHVPGVFQLPVEAVFCAYVNDTKNIKTNIVMTVLSRNLVLKNSLP